MIHPYSHYAARGAQRWPDSPALVEGGRTISYEELDSRATRVAGALQRAGLEPGERVALLQHNSVEYVELAIAIARSGGVLVPMLGALTGREHRYMVADSGARYVVATRSEDAPRAVEAAASNAEPLCLGPAEEARDLEGLADERGARTIAIDRPPEALAQILYTSGTTGRPKGVTHSYASVSAAMSAWATAFSLSREDRLLGQLALSHFGGRSMDSCLVAGACLVILAEAEPGAMLRTIERYRVTMVCLVPTLLRTLLDHPECEGTDLSSLRVVLYAAAPAAPALVRRAFARLGPVLYTGFGQTEAYGLNTWMDPHEHELALRSSEELLTSIGRECAAFAQVSVRDDEGRALPPGEVGEIWVSAPWTTPGFWRRDDLDQERLRDGWLRTGDLGRADRNGYLFLADRREDMVITGGFNVYPSEVEHVLAEHPAVAECGVFSVPDPKWGEALRAAVVLRPGATTSAEELTVFARERLARFKVPKAIDLVAELPKTPVGKILRRELRAPFWEGRERSIHGAE